MPTRPEPSLDLQYVTPDEKKAVGSILGEKSFQSPDRRGGIWPEMSEGIGAARMLRHGYTPSDVVTEFRGAKFADIPLPTQTLAGKMDARNPRLPKK